LKTKAIHQDMKTNIPSSSQRSILKRLYRIVCGAGLAFALSAEAQLLPGGAPNEPDYAPGELIIKFKPGATEAELLDAWRGPGLALIKSVKFKNPNHPGLTHVTTRFAVPQAVQMLANHPAVEYAEPNYTIRPAVVPNDERYFTLWGMPIIGAPLAWNVTTGSSGVLVAVVDTGIDISHPDLAPNIWTNADEIPNDGLDNDGNGYVDDVNGWDYWNDDNGVFDPVDGDRHGTHVAGTIGAVGNNGIGVAGVNWTTRILPLKFIGPEIGRTLDAVRAIQYASEKGARVFNASFVMSFFSQSLMDAIEDSGVIFVAADGNDGANTDVTPNYPSGFNLPNIISVAATRSDESLAPFSNYGATSVDLGAPGALVHSTVPGNGYDGLTGTSMAAPHVAGAAALIYSRFPNLTVSEVKDRILASVDPLSSLAGKTLTGGRLNVGRIFDESILVASDGFDTGNGSGGAGWQSVWTITGDAIVTSLEGPSAGTHHARLRSGTGYIERTVNLSGASSARLQFLAKVNSFDKPDRASVRVGAVGQSLTQVMSFTRTQSDNLYHSYQVDLTPFISAGTLRIAFDAEMADASDFFYVDDVRITASVPPIGSHLPVAHAGGDITVSDADGNGSQIITLDGSGSWDPDGTIIAYEWRDEFGAILSTTATFPAEVPVGAWTLSLTVTDNSGAVATDTINLTVHSDYPAFLVSSWDFMGNPLTWTQDSQNAWISSTQRASQDTRSAEADGPAVNAGMTHAPLNLRQRTAATISFDWFIESSLDAGEYLAFDITTDGGATWTEMARLRADIDAENVWHPVTLEVAAPESTLQLRFRATMDRSDEDANVDSVRVTAH
jgi:subtilisin family serine protease